MEPAPPRIAVYPGSFDPITLGHLNVIERASRLFDRLIVGVGINIEKQAMFAAGERVELIREATCSPDEHRDPHAFQGLAVDFVRQTGARVMVRGVRPITDIAAELTMMMANRRLAPGHGNAFHDRRRRAGPRFQFAHQADCRGWRAKRSWRDFCRRTWCGRCGRSWQRERQEIDLRRSLQILRSKAGSFCHSGEHTRTDLVFVMKGKYEVRPLRAFQDTV